MFRCVVRGGEVMMAGDREVVVMSSGADVSFITDVATSAQRSASTCSFDRGLSLGAEGRGGGEGVECDKRSRPILRRSNLSCDDWRRLLTGAGGSRISASRISICS